MRDLDDNDLGGDGGGGRGDLLAQIRNSGLGNLKSAKDRALQEQKAKKTETKKAKSAPEPMDMFGDLLQALNNRRKGISNKRDFEQYVFFFAVFCLNILMCRDDDHKASKADDDAEWED